MHRHLEFEQAEAAHSSDCEPQHEFDDGSQFKRK